MTCCVVWPHDHFVVKVSMAKPQTLHSFFLSFNIPYICDRTSLAQRVLVLPCCSSYCSVDECLPSQGKQSMKQNTWCALLQHVASVDNSGGKKYEWHLTKYFLFLFPSLPFQAPKSFFSPCCYVILLLSLETTVSAATLIHSHHDF